jgi:hypothetical protein
MQRKFRYGWVRRWLNLLLVILVGVYFSLIGSALILDSDPFGFLSVMIVILLGGMLWSEWSYFIEFYDEGVAFKKYVLFPLKVARVSYTDILYIRRSSRRAYLDVITSDGKTIKLASTIEGGIGVLIDEFQRHLRANQIQSGIKSAYKKFNLYEKGMVVLLVLWLPLAILISPMKTLSSIVAWKTVWPSLFYMPGRVESFWMNSDQEIWLSFSKVFNDDWLIVKLETDKETVIFNVEGTLVQYPELILADQHDQPWIVQGDALFHLVDAQWQKNPLSGYGITPWRNSPIVMDDGYWVGAAKRGDREDSKKYFLAEINLSTGDVRAFDLPEVFNEDEFFIYQIQSAGKYPVVMITSEYNPVYFYSMDHGEWKKEAELQDVEWVLSEFYADLPIEDQEPFLQFGGFTVDQAGNIWVVLDRNSKPVIGKFDRVHAEWVWSDVENDCNLCLSHYSDIVVDKFERVWLRAEYSRKREESDKWYTSDGWGLDVFQPIWNTSAHLVVRYTTRNSGYETGYGANRLRLDNDGRIWSAGDRLVWIDSTKQDLPNPFSFGFLGYIPLSYFTGFGLMLIFEVIYRLKLQKYDLSPLPETRA